MIPAALRPLIRVDSVLSPCLNAHALVSLHLSSGHFLGGAVLVRHWGLESQLFLVDVEHVGLVSCEIGLVHPAESVRVSGRVHMSVTV